MSPLMANKRSSSHLHITSGLPLGTDLLGDAAYDRFVACKERMLYSSYSGEEITLVIPSVSTVFPRTLTSPQGRELWGKELGTRFFLCVWVGVTRTTMSAYPCFGVGPINTG